MIVKRKNAKGETRYQVRVNNKSLGTKPTLVEARRLERDHFEAKAVTDSLTVDQLVARYLDLWERGKLGPKPKRALYVSRRRNSLTLLSTFFSSRGITTITATEAEDFAAAHPTAAGHASIVFNYAVSRRLVEHNEFAPFVPKQGRGRTDLDPLSDTMVSRLQEVVESVHGLRMGAMVPFWAYSGLRSSELYGLDWSDIDWEAGEIIVRDGKTGPRRALLLDPAREAIESFRGIAGPIFTTPITGKRLTTKNMAQSYTAEIRKKFNPHPPTKFDWYELRHFNAHLLYVRMDVPSPIVAAHLGNSPEMVERRYGHFKVGALDRLREMVKHGIPREEAASTRTSLAHFASKPA